MGERAAIWIREPVDRSGAAAYTHLIRDPDDPTRSSRPSQGGYEDKTPHRSLDEIDPETLEHMILDLLSDGEPRTFNRIAVELWDLTADIAFGTAADEALWRLVGTATEHTNEAPVLFRLIPGRLEGSSVEDLVRQVPGRQLQLALMA